MPHSQLSQLSPHSAWNPPDSLQPGRVVLLCAHPVRNYCVTAEYFPISGQWIASTGAQVDLSKVLGWIPIPPSKVRE